MLSISSVSSDLCGNTGFVELQLSSFDSDNANDVDGLVLVAIAGEDVIIVLSGETLGCDNEESGGQSSLSVIGLVKSTQFSFFLENSSSSTKWLVVSMSGQVFCCIFVG